MDGNQGKSNDGGLEISPVKSNNTKSINESDLGQTRFEDSRGGGWKMAPESELIIERSTESTEEPVSLKSGLLSYCLSCKKKPPWLPYQTAVSPFVAYVRIAAERYLE